MRTQQRAQTKLLTWVLTSSRVIEQSRTILSNAEKGFSGKPLGPFFYCAVASAMVIRVQQIGGLEMPTLAKRITIHFDGSCESNGSDYARGGWGYHTEIDGKQIERSGVCASGSHGFEKITNNVTEHYAAYEALCLINDLGIMDAVVTLRGDSKLVVMQMNGRWRAKSGPYKQVYEKSMLMKHALCNRRIRVVFEWIPREQNARADMLSTRYLGESRHKFVDGIIEKEYGERRGATAFPSGSILRRGGCHKGRVIKEYATDKYISPENVQLMHEMKRNPSAFFRKYQITLKET